MDKTPHEGSSKMVMAATPGDNEDARALPTNRAFVLQFRRHADIKGGCVDGRIEHITSGRAELFHTLEELVSFVGESLEGQPDTRSKNAFDQDH